MNEFETMVAKMLKEGVSPEDLARQMTNAVNAAKVDNKGKLIANMRETLMDNLKRGTFSYGDAAAIATLVAFDINDRVKKLTEEQLRDYYKFATEVVKGIEKHYEIVMNLQKIDLNSDKVRKFLDVFTF